MKPGDIEARVHELISRHRNGDACGMDMAEWLGMDIGEYLRFLHKGEFPANYTPPVRPMPLPEPEVVIDASFNWYAAIFLVLCAVGFAAFVLHQIGRVK